jgi:hypothetical protein
MDLLAKETLVSVLAYISPADVLRVMSPLNKEWRAIAEQVRRGCPVSGRAGPIRPV